MDGNDIHNLEGISEFVEKINSVIPYTSYDLLIGNSISFLHANNVYVSKRKLLTKSLNSVEIGDIIGEVTSYEDSTHSITLDTFGLHYYVMVSADTSFGSIFLLARRKLF